LSVIDRLCRRKRTCVRTLSGLERYRVALLALLVRRLVTIGLTAPVARLSMRRLAVLLRPSAPLAAARLVPLVQLRRTRRRLRGTLTGAPVGRGDRHADQLLDVAEKGHLLVIDEGDRDAFGAGARGAA